MPNTIVLRLALVLLLAGCAAARQQLGTELAPQISTEVARQLRDESLPQGISAEPSVPDTPAPPAPQASYDCEPKTCGSMASCEEAVYQLRVCGFSRLDGNEDGVPCQSLCANADVAAIAASLSISAPLPAAASGEMALVTRVIDGDTIAVMLNGVDTRVRYLQINTPERDEACFQEATQANADLVAGKTVRLVRDKQALDRYGRLLRYIYVDDLLVNRALVEGGYAEVALYPPNDAHYAEFARLEREAATAGRGCHPTGVFDDGSMTR